MFYWFEGLFGFLFFGLWCFCRVCLFVFVFFFLSLSLFLFLLFVFVGLKAFHFSGAKNTHKTKKTYSNTNKDLIKTQAKPSAATAITHHPIAPSKLKTLKTLAKHLQTTFKKRQKHHIIANLKPQQTLENKKHNL